MLPDAGATFTLSTAKGDLLSLSADGVVRWKTATGIPTQALLRAMPDEGLLWMGAEDYNIYAYGLDDGQQAPDLTCKGTASAGAFRSQPVGTRDSDGSPYLCGGSLTGFFHAFRADSPEVLAEFNANADGAGQFWASGERTPDGSILVGSTNGYLYKFKLQ